MNDLFIQGNELWLELKDLPKGKAPAVVFNAHITGLAIARSLGKAGVPVIALDRDGRAVGLHSKYAFASVLCPNPFTEEAAFIELLLETGKRLPQKGVLYPCNDEWVLAVSRHREQLEAYYEFPFAEWEAVESLLNKEKLYKRAAELSIPIPATWYPNDWDKDGSIPNDIPYPCIVKPIEQRSFYEAFQKKAITAESREDLADAIAAAAPHPVVVQEIVGESLSDFYSLCTYVDTTGEVKGYFTGRKLEQYPQSFGTGCLVESSPVDEFVTDAAKILNAAGYYGISEIEFIYDKRDGSYKLLDVNTRVWKWIGLPVFAGVNLPLLAYRDALGLPIGQEHPVKDYAKWVYYQDYMSLKKERPNHVHGHLTDEELTHFVSGKMPSGNLIDAVYDEDDPAPSVRLLKNQYQSGYVCPC